MTEVVKIDASLGALAVEVVGYSDPVIFLHSLVVDRRSWRCQRDASARSHRLALVDGPGHEQNGHPNRKCTMDDECADAAVAVLDAFELGC
ncbi:MAG: hypothetical protein WCE62_12570 [Polyangiales bacterium]